MITGGWEVAFHQQERHQIDFKSPASESWRGLLLYRMQVLMSDDCLAFPNAA
jgi:hypothetical protein